MLGYSPSRPSEEMSKILLTAKWSTSTAKPVTAAHPGPRRFA